MATKHKRHNKPSITNNFSFRRVIKVLLLSLGVIWGVIIITLGFNTYRFNREQAYFDHFSKDVIKPSPDPLTPYPTPISITENVNPKNGLKYCYSRALKVTAILPNSNWSCSGADANEYNGNINVQSNLFQITISNFGRGPLCDSSPNECHGTIPFYSNKSVNLEYNPTDNREIWGSLTYSSLSDSLTWMSIKYPDMKNRTLIPTEMQELASFLDLISYE